ncbi:MAG: tetratricopeptide repeat protein, partial [Thermoplasmata archaeon]|nr:tetratricopeptide repeat protein [Thermoplasmata archaeon]NIS10462.1 tetratricopeptide repeat protein [Thermoplasmata archaeon]NIS18428.1 tetratricopeptide repeat protein [Thermoplasmata archaeon]NIT75416.1 tetratricopeptide repeat protein [Thermoplasmata archaeon]NIU47584.1 tetratricopeptide repeat protein [Thermoplasmata archaeon]
NEDFDEAHFLRGELLEELGRPKEAKAAYDDALAAVTRAITSRPAQGRMWERKGRMLAELGEYSEAVRCYDTALLMPRTSMAAREARADVLIRSHRYVDAIDSLRILEGGDRPDPTDLRLRIAGSMAELGRVDDVREELADMLDGTGDPEVDLNGPGDEAAVESEGSAVDEGPASRSPPSSGKEGQPMEVDGRSSADIVMPYEPSKPSPREVGEEDRARALHALGRAELVAEETEGALRHLREAANLVPDLPALQLDIGNTLMELGDVKGALQAFEDASGVDLDDESPRALAGLCHLRLGDTRAAEREFDAAIGITPEYALAWLGK